MIDAKDCFDNVMDRLAEKTAELCESDRRKLQAEFDLRKAREEIERQKQEIERLTRHLGNQLGSVQPTAHADDQVPF